MYSLEYKMMVQALRKLGYTGEFQAEVPSQAALRDGGRALLHVQSGSVTSCTIFDRYGQRLYHDSEAQRVLLKLGILEWKLVVRQAKKSGQTPPPERRIPQSEQMTPQPGFMTPPPGQMTPQSGYMTSPSGQQMSPASSDHNPRHVAISPEQMHTWSAMERSVYFLADGTRSIEQIAKLLSRPPATVEQIIQALERSGAIVRV